MHFAINPYSISLIIMILKYLRMTSPEMIQLLFITPLCGFDLKTQILNNSFKITK